MGMNKRAKSTKGGVKISILVPIYNVSEYLDECLSSIKEQTLGEIEIICINDGSTDNSLDIIKKYAKDDDRFVIIDKKNSGYGDSMNHGLKKATGEFIGIVESDDFIKHEMFEDLYRLASKNNTQVAKGNALWYWTSTNKAVKTNLVDEKNLGKVITPRDERGIFYKIPSIWAAIYRRDFIEKNNITFSPTPGASYQDTGFSYKVWSMADRVIFTDKAYLYYRQDNMASSMNNIATKAPILFSEFESIEKYLKEHGREELLLLIREREFVSLYNFLVHMDGQPARDFAKKLQGRFDGVKLDASLFETAKIKKVYSVLLRSPELYFSMIKAKHYTRRAAGMAYRLVPPAHRSREIKWLQAELAQRKKTPGPKREYVNTMEKKSPAISVIVPVYNAEKYLKQCLESLMAQTLREIEIVCVDDKSTDKSTEILATFAKKDKRIKIVKNTKKGIATARNTGLKHATAPYIMWCDSDDFYDKKMCERMLATMRYSKSDIVECATKVIYDDLDEDLKRDVERYLRLKMVNKHKLNDWIIINSDASLWNKIYKREIIDKGDIRFPEGVIYEDAYFNDVYMVNCESISFLNERLYNYRRHSESVMSQSFKKTGIAADYQEVAERLYKYLQENNLYDTHKDLFWERFCRYNSFAFNNLHSGDRSKARQRAQRFLRDHKNEVEALDATIQRTIKKTLFFGQNVPSVIKRVIKKIYYADPTRNRQIRKIETLQDEIVDSY